LKVATSEQKTLESIDAKLGGLLVLLLDLYLRDTDLAKPKPRTVDKMLSDVGLPTAEIASLLGKTERAVQMQLAAGSDSSKKQPATKGKK
jgi:hypothetical protein